ncbi:unnamed protein product [Umbelopsis ramanniana]
MKGIGSDDKPPSYDSLYTPTAPPLPHGQRYLNTADYQQSSSVSGGCNPFCPPRMQARNSYDSASAPPFPPYTPYNTVKPSSIDHIPEQDRKGVLWSGSGVQIADSGAKRLHAEIAGSLTAGGMTIRTARDKTVDIITIQLDVFLMHVPDEDVSLSTECTDDSYRYTLKTPKSLGFKRKVRAFWLITIPDHWMRPERLSASLVNSSIVGLDGLGDIVIGEMDLRTTNGRIIFETVNATRLTLITTNGPIKALAYNADDITLETTNGPINGLYMAKNYVKAKTTNGAIEMNAEASDVSITTTNNFVKGAFKATKDANIQSSSGYLQLKVDSERIKVSTSNGPISGDFNGKDVSIKTTNAKISSVNVTGKDIKVQTTNAAIEGNFMARKEITLKTTNAKIASNCRLEETGGDINISTSNATISGSYEAPGGDVDMYTSNGKITPSKVVGRKVKFITNNSSIKADVVIGQQIKATTSHSNVELKIGLDDSKKRVDIYVETSHSLIDVEVPDAVIGTFDVSTAHKTATVEAPNPLNIVFEKSEKDCKIGRKVPESDKSEYRESKIQIVTRHAPATLTYV